jgi:hypothetical protein
MDIEGFNKTLSSLDQVVIKKFDDYNLGLTLEVNSSGGGPGENVTAYITAKSVCFISIPMVIDFTDSPQIRVCNTEQALSVLPSDQLVEGYGDEVKEGIMKVLQFLDGKKELQYCIACYEFELFQNPKDWYYGNE